MTHAQRQRGFSVVEIVIIVCVVIVLVLVGYWVVGGGSKPASKSTTTTHAQQAPAVSDKEDLSQAVTQLKKVDTSTKKDEQSLRQLVE